MNFKELLDYPVEKVETDCRVLFGHYYNHVDGLDRWSLKDDFENQDKIKIHYLKDFCFDGRRVWKLYYVTFEDDVVMFCKNAGREGDDHHGKAILNTDLYFSMLGYIKSFEQVGFEVNYTFKLEDAADDFVYFYNNHLTDTFTHW